MLLFFPQPTVELVSNSIAKSNIHIFLDDSFSIVKSDKQKKVEKLLKSYREQCKKTGCNLRLTKMSDVYPETNKVIQMFLTQLVFGSQKQMESHGWSFLMELILSQKEKWSEQISGIASVEQKIMGLSIYTGNNFLNYSVAARQDTFLVLALNH